jgi:SNF2 family DNA or RNA helicase
VRTHGTLTFDPTDRGSWAIQATPDVAMRLKRIFPRAAKRRGGSLVLSHGPEVARDLEWVMDRWPLKVDDFTRRLLAGSATKHRETEERVTEILNGNRTHLHLPEPSRPGREYQLQAADLALTTGRLLLGDDLGLGKTMSCLLTLRDAERLPALIVCPTHLPAQWAYELGLTLPWLTPHIIRSMRVYNPADRRELRGHDPDVLIVGYSKLRGWGDHLAGKVRTVIFDEMQELRHPDTEKYTAAATIADAADLVMGATATPVYNYGGEIYNLFNVLEKDALGTRGEFGREWCGGDTGPKALVRDPRALGHHLREAGLMLRRTRKDVGRELPAVQRIPHNVDVDQAVYDQLMEGAADLANVILNSGDRKAAFTASGDLDMQMRKAAGVAKAPYVAEFVRLLLESERKVVLWGWHRAVYEIWNERLAEFNPAMYTGTESPAQKREAVDRFLHQDDDGPGPGESRVFIMSLRSGAGLNGLQTVCSTGVFGELDWSPGMHDQCVGRLSRDGQIAGTVAYFLTSDHGADPVIAEVLNLKRMQAEPIRNPDMELFEPQTADPDRVRRLAAGVLTNRKVAA